MPSHADREALPDDEAERAVHQHRAGPTVDEAALIKALQQGWIAGAGLDVLEHEPPQPDNPLLKMDNVILTAHVASASARFDPARRRRVGQEIALVAARLLAARLRQSDGSGEDRPQALAALLDGARPGDVSDLTSHAAIRMLL